MLSGRQTISPRRPYVEKGLPLPSSSKRGKKHYRLPFGYSITAGGGRSRRWPIVVVLVMAAIIFLTFIPSSAKSLRPASSHPHSGGAGNAGVAGFERERHGGREEDVMAEDDLVVQQIPDAKPKSPDQLVAEAEADAAKAREAQNSTKDQLMALIYWISRGGRLQDGFSVPDPRLLRKIGADGFRNMLENVAGSPDDVFKSDWKKEAETYLRVTVFSKSYCPHSRRAKDILEQYQIVPEPFIIELDEREDTSIMQDILQSLTGRRTVPNVIIDFASIGGADETTLLHHEGGLGKRVEKYVVADDGVVLGDLDEMTDEETQAALEEKEARKVAEREQLVKDQRARQKHEQEDI